MWRIGIPAWGERCVPLAVNVGIPSIVAALLEARQDAHFTVHTDQPDAFADSFAGHSYDCRYVRADEGFHTFVACHYEVLRDASDGEFVSLLDGDHLVSREMFVACEHRFSQGKKLVVTNGVRTSCGDYLPPPAGSPAADISEFIFQYPHPITQDLVWPTGKTTWPSMVYFRDAENLIAHCFHLHPVGFVARSGLTVDVSVDGDLVDGFSQDEIHIVTDPNELAIAEISPTDKMHMPNMVANTVDSIVGWAAHPPGRTTKMHRWFFRHTIVHRGSADAFDLSPINEILDQLHEPTLWMRAAPQ